MLKRIAVISKNKTLNNALAKAAKGKKIEAVSVASATKLPVAAAAAIGDAKDAAALIKAGSALGARQEQLLELIAEAIDCRESLAVGNSLRVRDHATRLAKVLKLSPDDQLTFERGALLRDIGKLRIPNDVLLKFDVLTYDEWELLRQHTVLGAKLVAKLGAVSDIKDIVHYHHECFDGTGYPKGLEGNKIPFLARAMKVVDVYCAMTSPRKYRAGTNSGAATIAHLKTQSGRHFDPEIVKAFITGKVVTPK